MRTVGDNMSSGEQTGLVDKMIGTSYDIVKLVAYNIGLIKRVELNLENIVLVGEASVDIQNFMRELELFRYINTHLQEIIGKSGGWQSVADADAMNLIPINERVVGMAVFVRDENVVYTWDATDGFQKSFDLTAALEAGQVAVDAEASIEVMHQDIISKYAVIQTIASTGVGKVLATWRELSALPGLPFDGAIVVSSDTGSHMDPVTSQTVPNTGTFSRYPAGWKYIGPLIAKGEDSIVPGPAGGAANSYKLLSDVKTKAVKTDVAINYDGCTWFYTLGDFTGEPVGNIDTLIIKEKNTSLAVGAWVRQFGTHAKVEYFGAVDDGAGYEFDPDENATDNAVALGKAWASRKNLLLTGTYMSSGSTNDGQGNYDKTFTSSKVQVGGPGTIVHKRNADGIMLYIEGQENDFDVRIQGYNASLTGSVVTSFSTITGSIARDGETSVLTLTAGTLQVGTFLNLDGVYFGEFVIERISPTLYRLSGIPRTVASRQIPTRLITLTASNVVGTIRTSPHIGTGSMLHADGLRKHTMIISQLTGVTGGNGTYALNIKGNVSERQMLFTDVPTMNLYNDLIRLAGEAKTNNIRARLFGSAGGGIANYGTPGLTVKSGTRIMGVYDNGIISGNLGADDFTVEDDVEVEGTGRQNAIFTTANLGSSPTNDKIYRVKIGKVRLKDAGDTPLEIGQNTYNVFVDTPILGPGTNPAFLVRDAHNVRVVNPTFIGLPIDEQNPNYTHFAVTPYYKGVDFDADIQMTGVTSETPARRGFASVGQSNVWVLNSKKIKTGAVAADGSDLIGTFGSMNAGANRIGFLNNMVSGFALDYDFNFGASVGATFDRFLSEGNEFDGTGQHINGYRTAFTNSRTKDTIHKVRDLVYGYAEASSVPVQTVVGMTNEDSINTAGFGSGVVPIYSPQDAPQKGFGIRENTMEFRMPSAQYSAYTLGVAVQVGSRSTILTLTDGSGDASFSISASSGKVTKIGGSDNLLGSDGATGFTGWAVYVVSGLLTIQRRGADIDTTNINGQWSIV